MPCFHEIFFNTSLSVKFSFIQIVWRTKSEMKWVVVASEKKQNFRKINTS